MRATSNLLTKKALSYNLAYVREFGLTRDDCYGYLLKLGYDVKVEFVAVSIYYSTASCSVSTW